MHPLTRRARINLHTLLKNTHELVDAEASRSPIGDLNSVAWVLGHIIAYRDRMLALLGGTAILDPDESAPFQKGTKPGTEPPASVPLSKLLLKLEASQNQLESLLEAEATLERLAHPAPEGIKLPMPVATVEEVLDFLFFHETYHCGQVGILRRALGYDGAI